MLHMSTLICISAWHFDVEELISTNICVKKQDLVPPMGTNSILQYGPPQQMGTSTDVFHGVSTLPPGRYLVYSFT